ncbi:carbohydrate-binding domain-containing protein [Demequina sp. NBRC 110054]|uniref:carbohydrate-binding domain-containing protein n=1 Tax=Demequina sp. NBRC 110054 TaxID=1570343 RepID=UPI000A04F7F9|nr:carbohydrate-binding domain-containing protein [Demequina sp. NBRC 110054]
MKFPRRPALAFASLAATSALLLAGCTSDTTDSSDSASGSDTTTSESSDSSTETVSSAVAEGEATYDDIDLPDVDLSPDASSATEITLADGASSGGDGVSVDGDTITITAAGTYVLSGELSDGQIVVDVADGDVTLILDGVDITSDGAPAITVDDADNLILYTASGSTNYVSDTGTYDDTDEDTGGAAIYSTADLFLAGEGTLVVDAGRNDGITSKDSLVIASGTYEVSAADDGIRGKDHLIILDGTVTVDATGDALKSDNEADEDEPDRYVGIVWIAGGTIDLTAGTDGIDAANQVTIEGGDMTVDAGDDGIHSEVYLRIGDAEIDILNSYEGLEAAVIYLDSGAVSIVSSDDGINGSDGSGSSEMGGMGGGGGGMGGGPGSHGASDTSGSDDSTTAETADYSTATDTTETETVADDSTTVSVEVYISGGTYLIDADGDGLDSNGTITMTGGTVVISGPEDSGNGAIDYNGTFDIDGGTIAASGSSGMAEAPDGGDQAVLGMTFGSSVTEGTVISVVDSDGELVMSFTTEKLSASLILSSAELESGETYTVYADGEVSGGEEVGPLTIGGTLSGGEELGTLTAS